MRITKYAQSTFLLENSSGKRLLIDPGKYNFEGSFGPSDWGQLDVLIITHKHEDHFDLGAVRAICRNAAPVIITNLELSHTLSQAELRSTVITVGETLALCGFSITAIVTDHVVRWEPVLNFGIVIEADGVRIYHTSDTRYIEPPLLGVQLPIDVLLVPIGNRGVVMGCDDAALFATQIAPRIAIPMHYDSPKDRGRVDPGAFASALAGSPATTVRILSFAESLDSEREIERQTKRPG